MPGENSNRHDSLFVMTDQHPRLLIATEFPPNASGGGPAVVRQMLQGWPVDRLFWWSCLPEQDKHFGQETAAQVVTAIPSRLYPNQRWAREKCWLLENLWTHWAARHFRETLDAFKPDAVWVIPHAWSIPPLAAVLPNARIGFHTSIHDYADVQGNAARFGSERTQRMAGLADQLYAKATTRDAISHPMVADLQARTGCDGVVSHAGLEADDFAWLAGKTPRATAQIRIAYAGTIIVEETFELLVSTLARIRSQLPLPVKLLFFGAHSYQSRRWFDSAWMFERGNLAEPALTLALRECDWGFLPMSLTEADPRYNRFSLPTKLISYLAAGLPLITIGHPESSAVKLASAYGMGICSTSAQPDVLGRELLAGLSLKSPWEVFGAEVVRCGKTECDAQRMRNRLHDCFRICSGQPQKLPTHA